MFISGWSHGQICNTREGSRDTKSIREIDIYTNEFYLNLGRSALGRRDFGVGGGARFVTHRSRDGLLLGGFGLGDGFGDGLGDGFGDGLGDGLDDGFGDFGDGFGGGLGVTATLTGAAAASAAAAAVAAAAGMDGNDGPTAACDWF